MMTKITASANNSKYDIRVNPVYQVDYAASTNGKRVSLTKKKIRFSFGFSNKEAILNGHKGVDCRGEEHDVTFIWSITSGKRMVTIDGEQIHFSRGRRTELRFECSWTMAGHHTLKLVAYATRMMQGSSPAVRQFDLFIDGLSYFSMPKIYELGIVTSNEILNRGMQGKKSFTNAPKPLATAPFSESMSRKCRVEPNVNTTHQNLNLPDSSLMVQHTPIPKEKLTHFENQTRTIPQPLTNGKHFQNNSLTVNSFILSPSVAQINVECFSPAQMNQVQPFVSVQPVESQKDPIRPVSKGQVSDSYDNITGQILKAYLVSPVAPSIQESSYDLHSFHSSKTIHQNMQIPKGSTNSKIEILPNSLMPESAKDQGFDFQYLYGSGLSDLQKSAVTSSALDDVAAAMKNLVNLEDIREPVVSHIPLSINCQHVDKNKNKNGKSTPLPPVTPWNITSNVSLSAIQTSTHRAPPSRQVMRTNTINNISSEKNQLVAYGLTPQQNPPIETIHQPFGRASLPITSQITI